MKSYEKINFFRKFYCFICIVTNFILFLTTYYESCIKNMEKDNEYSINAYIGLKLKNRRTELGFTQQELGDTLGISFQQIQKYEKGVNKINASNLFELAKVLKVPVSYFFDGYDSFSGTVIPTMNEVNSTFAHEDVFSSIETLNLLNYYYKLNNTKLRKKILDLVRFIAVGEQQDGESDVDIK